MSYLFRNEFDGRDHEGKRHLNKGGGGGSSGVYYANQDKLLGVQADIAQNMYNVYADYAPGRLQAMDRMVNEAMDGTLADRARSTAAADAGASLGNSLAGAQRSLERYGTTLNPNALNANLTNTALSEAALRSGSMNRAQQWAEGQKWARNSDMYGTLQGMPGTATQALGSAASGYGQMAGQQNQVNMANAMGYGQMGGMIGYGLMARDGGYIHEGEVVRQDDEPGFAAGGMPRLANWRNYPTTQQNDTGTPSPIGQVAAGAAPMLAMYGVKNYVKPALRDTWQMVKNEFTPVKDGMGTLQNISEADRARLTEQGLENARNNWPGSSAPEAVTAPVAEQSAATGTQVIADTGANVAANTTADLATVAPSATGDVVNGVATTANALGESAAAAGTAEAAASTGTALAAEGAGTTLASAAGTALPVLGAGLALYSVGSALDWWADGGPVPHEQPRGLRKNMIPGGPVRGPGTETSDSIPAWLSDGEFVLNAQAVKEVGKKKLEKINEKGLKKRKAKAKAAAPKAAGMKKPVKK